VVLETFFSFRWEFAC